jgi:hypothetical protein
MADAYTTKKVNDILASHSQTVQQMRGSAQQLGDLGKRGVQLWAMAMEPLTQEERDASGLAFAADANQHWVAVKANLVAGLDSFAASQGITRAQLLADLADEPATNFGL